MSDREALAPHIAYCGLDCSGCEVFQATAWNDDSIRKKYSDKVFSQWKIKVEPATINCHGCRDSRPKSGFCATCEVRQCAIERGLENCAWCEDYSCEKLQRVHQAMIHVGKEVDGEAWASHNLKQIRHDNKLDT